MRLGAHISTAGGAYNAFDRAVEATCDSMLIFTKSNRQWAAKPLTEEDIAKFRAAREAHSNIYPIAVHASYLINAASSDPDLWEKSYLSLKDEVERAAALGIPYLTFHPGSYMEAGVEAGLENIARAVSRLLIETDETAAVTTVCLENMAGQGTNIGGRFEHLASVLDAVGRHPRLGVCFDTCHAFSAGYDVRTPETYAATMAEFDRVVGLGHIRCFHFNDSKHGLGEGKDRHEHIGRGLIGTAGFANFVNDPRWAEHGAQLETPPTEDGEDGKEIDMNQANLAVLRGLIA